MTDDDTPKSNKKVLISVRVPEHWAEWIDSVRGELSRDAFFRMLMIQKHQAITKAAESKAQIDRIRAVLDANPKITAQLEAFADQVESIAPGTFKPSKNAEEQ